MSSSAPTCWIVVNGYLQQEKFSDLALFVKESAERKGISARIIRNYDLISIIDIGKAKLMTDQPLPDFVLFLDKDIHLARQLELLGLPVYNRSEAIDICDSKAKTHQALANHDISDAKNNLPPFYIRRNCTSKLMMPLVKLDRHLAILLSSKKPMALSDSRCI